MKKLTRSRPLQTVSPQHGGKINKDKRKDLKKNREQIQDGGEKKIKIEGNAY